MLLQEEQTVLQWLSQYGALSKPQVVKILQTPKKEAERLIKHLIQNDRISEISGGYYYGLDEYCKPDQKTITAVWVLLQFIDEMIPMAHYPTNFPSQLFFIWNNTEYEIVVLREGEENIPRLLRGDDNVNYIIVLPHIAMAKNLKKPNGKFCIATVNYKGSAEPEVSFYKESIINEDG